jgi:hypothetical protein
MCVKGGSMKFKVYLVTIIVLVAILSLISGHFRSGPSRTVRNYLELAGKEDKSTSKLYSGKIQNEFHLTGKEVKDLGGLRAFEDIAPMCGGIPSIEVWGESIKGETAKVVTTYNCKGASLDYRFTLIKEGGEWKIEAIDFLECEQ